MFVYYVLRCELLSVPTSGSGFCQWVWIASRSGYENPMARLTAVSCDLHTSCVVNYIIARSMKEGKGSQCQEGQGGYQEPKRSSWISLRNKSSIIIHHHPSSSIITILHHHTSSSSIIKIIIYISSSSIIIHHHNI